MVIIVSLSELILDKNYVPDDNKDIIAPFSFKKVIKCPVEFTDDPFEYIESYLGYKLRKVQRIIIEDLFSVDSETQTPIYDEAVVVAGMRSGKSVLGGMIGSFLLHKLLAMDDPGLELDQLPGQMLSAEYIATTEKQSQKTAYASFVTIITTTPWWRKYIGYLKEREVSEGKETLFKHYVQSVTFLEKNLEVLSLHSNSSSIAGLTAFFVCFDEMSRFNTSEKDIQSKTERQTAQAVYFTASRAAKTLKGFSKVLTITSPMYENDFGMQLLYMCSKIRGGSGLSTIEALRLRYPKRVSNMIGYHYATHEANPKTEDNPRGFTKDSFEVEKDRGYATYMRDYMAIPPSAIRPFFDLPERIDNSVNSKKEPIVVFKDKLIEFTVGHETRKYIGKDVTVLAHNKVQKYFICCDQGAVKDSFTVAMGHASEVMVEIPDSNGNINREMRHKIIIDFVEAWVPNKENRITVSFQNVEEVIRKLNTFFYIAKVAYDSWHSTESIERLFSEGVYTIKIAADIKMYETMKLLVYSNMVELPYNDLLLSELRQLNDIKGKKVDHPPEGCLAGSTKILMADGTTAEIQDLAKKGKNNFFKVIAHSKYDTIPVLAYNAHKTKTVNEYIEIIFSDKSIIRCTLDHKWLLSNNTYKEAAELRITDKLMQYDDKKHIQIKSIQKKNGKLDVFDITVPVFENFALANGLFVHNSKDLADAVVRVVWCVYIDSIRDSIHGNFMLPINQKFSTARSLTPNYSAGSLNMMDELYPHYGVFGPAKRGGSVFGKSAIIVESNVTPNFTKFK